MKTDTERIIGRIETWLFGEYFKQLANKVPTLSMKTISGTFDNEKSEMYFYVKTIDDCHQMVSLLGDSRQLVDSKYGFMGEYEVKDIKIVKGKAPILAEYIPSVYYISIKVEYKFDDLDWDKVKDTHKED